MGFRVLISLILMSILLSSCKSEYDEMLSNIEEGMKATGFTPLLDKKYLIILPRTGCTGCIGSVESFLMTDSQLYSEQINVLLTDVVSLKTARIKLGKELMSKSYVFVDEKSDFYRGTLVSMYPFILYLDNGKIEMVEEVSPQNSQALDNLLFALSQ